MLKCVLIIDDDGITRALYSMILSDMEIAEKIGSFSYGAHAIEFINTYVPEVIFVDLNMPLMDGFEVAQQLKEHAYRDKMKVVVMSAYFKAGEKEKLMKIGVEDFILKPLNEKSILKMLPILAC